MAKKKSTATPILGRCEVYLCKHSAIYGFREKIDVTNNDSPGRAKEFIINSYNWCQLHDAEQRPLYARKEGKYVP